MITNEKTQQNVELMIEAIKGRLKMATAAAMQPSAFSVEQYDDIKDVYDIVMSKSSYSISEMEALVSELGRLRRG
ncbi:DUF1128 domain-containing protein [Paenibacillus thiaminolyticus]|uniref:DUF1128 domain-containing protein n=2 Tax=Paenibacillus TaxID=44249 RepID=A0A378X946_PANTH|nr:MULTISPECIES: DUF1128 domain-containing protein [Paenibacillus]MEB9896192.1 DUF1128 domain-containing protein [Bacillus cereus]MCY9536633.1 DUF1128 domain-containing protein [Paenibacillus thiaminolyticus]MCY9603824.1 DUF1128 domain-containing protein [Paenibacillus thiaminolyticus]MCY9609928.1 DUF1128 domain-containing protein [Paenibacillus thiaminolyticus]MCY9612870.1 DUF1128 domain-containing protein [Paenibacillus thiaminolyticus]